MSDEKALQILIESLLFENKLNERFGVDTEGLGPGDNSIGPQSAARMDIFNQPGPDPEADKAALEKADMAIKAQNIVTVGAIVDDIPNEDALFDDNYAPTNYDEMGNVTSFLIKSLKDIEDVDKSWKIITKALKKIKVGKWT